MNEKSIDILFIPVSSSSGAGECFRCLTLAMALQQQLPDLRIGICLNRSAWIEQPIGIDFFPLEDSPTRDEAGVNEWLDELRPDLVVFDSSLRQSSLKRARIVGASTVFISSRANRRRRGFGWRKLPLLDALWIIAPPSQHHLSCRERLKTAIAGTPHTEFVNTVLPESAPERRVAWLTANGLTDTDYIVVASGGGGGRVDDTPVARIFQESARKISAQSGMPTIFIAGPLSDIGLESTDGHIEKRAVSPRTLADLIAGANIVVTGGGSIIQQTLAAGRLCVAAPAAGNDQHARIETLAGEGLIQKAASSPDTICSATLELLQNTEKQSEIRRRVVRAGFTNGLNQLVSSAETLIKLKR